VKRDEAIAEMERLLAAADAEARGFSEEEQARFNDMKLIAMEPQMDTTLDQPTAPLRPVSRATRSLSAAVQADGLVARMLANGRARLDVPLDVRALGSDQALSPAPGYAVQPANLGPISTHHGIVSRLLFALVSIPISGTNAVTYTRVTYRPDIDSPSTGTGSKAAKVQELAAKPESILDTDEVTTPLDTYAHFLPCSRQVLDDVSGLRALLDVTLVAGLLDKTDAQLFADMTTALRFTPYTPTSGDTIGDGIARVATLLVTAGAVGVKVALNPTTLLEMSIAKTGGSGEYQGMPPNIPGAIVSSASVPAGKVLAWADTGAVWANREGVSVVAGLNSDDFVKNKVTLLAEHRGALLTLDAQHVYYGDATAA
jgi:HK97 family phage major capsid protein